MSVGESATDRGCLRWSALGQRGDSKLQQRFRRRTTGSVSVRAGSLAAKEPSCTAPPTTGPTRVRRRRRHILAVETAVASLFVIVAAVAVTGSLWLIVAGLAGHGLKDLWQHRTGFVAGTRWWPPFCATVDWVAAALLGAITAGLLPVA